MIIKMVKQMVDGMTKLSTSTYFNLGCFGILGIFAMMIIFFIDPNADIERVLIGIFVNGLWSITMVAIAFIKLDGETNDK